MSEHIWLIGASAGIGRALAHELAGRGHRLALSARHRDRLETLCAELPGEGHLAVPLDVVDDGGLAASWAWLMQEWPCVDTVIYAAGIYTPAGIEAYDTQRALKTIDINLQGIYRVLGHVLPYFMQRRAGRLVLFGSVAGYRGLPHAYDYCASKAAINNLAESLYPDLAAYRIRVQLVCPGFVKTRLTEQNEFPMPFRISPEEAARRIAEGMRKGHFEIHFPKKFTYIMKVLKIIPSRLYFWLVRQGLSS